MVALASERVPQHTYPGGLLAARMQVAVSRLGRIVGQGGLEGALGAMMLRGGLRTYVMDMGGRGLPKSRYPGVECSARNAGARGVYILECSGDGVRPREFYLDWRAGRFCMLHTAGDDGADAAVRLVARVTRLRRACVGSGMLETIAGVTGAGGNGRRRAARETALMERSAVDGSARAMVRWDGAILSTGGTSASAHLGLAGEVRDAYARMCCNIESVRGRVPVARGGVTHHVGRIIGFVPSRPIRDVPGLVGKVFTGEPPLLMGGSCLRIEGDHYAVPVVDRENAEYLHVNVSPNAFRVGINSRWPGASVLRLFGHLQLHHDPGLACPVAAGARGG